MRFTISFIFSIIFAVGLVAFAFTFYQSSTEKKQLNSELELRTVQVVKEIFKSDSLFFDRIDRENITHFADSINRQYNLLGLAIYYNHDSILSNYSTRIFIDYSKAYISNRSMLTHLLGTFSR